MPQNQFERGQQALHEQLARSELALTKSNEYRKQRAFARIGDFIVQKIRSGEFGIAQELINIFEKSAFESERTGRTKKSEKKIDD